MSTLQSAQFDFCSVPEAAKILGLTDGRIRQLILAEERMPGTGLKAHKLGEKNWAIPTTEVERFKKVTPRPGRPRTGSL